VRSEGFGKCVSFVLVVCLFFLAPDDGCIPKIASCQATDVLQLYRSALKKIKLPLLVILLCEFYYLEKFRFVDIKKEKALCFATISRV
jgi:hypothetical protein